MPALPRPTREQQLALLQDVARVCARNRSLDDVLGPVLRGLGDALALSRASLAVLDPRSRELVIEAAHGLTPAEIRRGRYRLGEGVTGQAAEALEPRIVPRIAAEPEFLDRTGALAEGDQSFVCVPVASEGRLLGVLAAFRPISQERELLEDVRVLQVVGSLLIPALRGHLEALEQSPPAVEAAEGRFRPRELLGRSKAWLDVLELMGHVTGSSSTVLLTGESGTGKELVARALHEHSQRSAGPFIRVNVAALPESLIEAELFGHERGAFTGATQQRKGRFELAHRGTLFLDEIGDLAPALQVKLLRVLQEREVERLGAARPIDVDVRVLAATSRDLDSLIEDERFRPDLYYRLAVFPIHLPPLRERQADILLLADHFVGVFNRAHGKAIRRISTSAIDMMMAYHWPGNIRELENCIERAVLLARDDVLLGHHLPPTLQVADVDRPQEGLRAQLDALERELVLDALKASRGNVAEAARQLRVSERILGLRVRKHDLDPRRFRVRAHPTSR